jgi:hypothetical protein
MNNVMQQNDDGNWVPATPLPRQGTQIDWEVSRKNGLHVARAYDADDKLIRTVRSRWPRVLALKIKFGGRS